jgi:predicted NBD/HSP70 family sugar kinase
MAQSSVSSTHLLRRINSAAVMRFALRVGRFSTTEAVRATSLTRVTVLSACEDLVAVGWLMPDDGPTAPPDVPPRRGRPARRFRVREGVCVVGVDAGQHHLTVAVADVHGTLLARRSVVVDSDALGREGRVREAGRNLDAALAEASRTRDDVLLTAVGVPAPIDGLGRSPEGINGFWPLMNAGFAEGLPGRVIVENDANLAALAEQAAEEDGAGENSATLLAGERFGAGLIVDDHLLRGAGGGAGEMRFLDAMFEDSEAGANGIGALARRWARQAVAEGGRPSVLRRIPVEDIEAPDVFRAARNGDAVACEVQERIARRLVRIVLALVSLLGMDRVIIAGALAQAVGPVVERTREILETDYYPPFPELVVSTLGGDVVMRGAVEYALTRVREEPLEITPEAE